ncbi:hypothetical protein D3C87_2073520 [compost metagenome]
MIAIRYAHSSGKQIDRFNLHRLNRFFVFEYRGLQTAIRERKPIHAEGAAMRLVSEITAISVPAFPFVRTLKDA